MEPQSVMTVVLQEEEEVPSREAHPEPQEAPACDSAPRTERESRRPSRERVPAAYFRLRPRLTRTAKSLTEEDAMELLSDIWSWNEENLDWPHIRQAITVTSLLMIIGGRVAGSPGLAVAGAIGIFLGAWMWWRYKIVPQMLKELTPKEKKKLRSQVMANIKDLEWTDIEELTEQVMTNKAVQEKLLELTMVFVTNKLWMALPIGFRK